MNRLSLICTITLIVGGFFTSVLNAQTADTTKKADTVTSLYSLGGEIRYWGELDQFSFVPDADPVGYHKLRTRLNVTLTPTSDLTLFIQAQDARWLGEVSEEAERGTLDSTAEAFDLHQAYFQVSNIFESNIDLTVGRQELSYGSERLIGSYDWNTVGRSFDAVKAAYSSGNLKLDLFGAKLNGITTPSASENLIGLYGVLSYLSPHVLDIYALVDNNTDTLTIGEDIGKSKLNRYTLGLYLHGTPTPIDYSAELDYQLGSITENDTSTTQSEIGAYLINGTVGYTFVSLNALRVGGSYTILSGDADPRDSKMNSFNTLFQSGYLYYGNIGYFPGLFPDNGLQDIELQIGGYIMMPDLRIDLAAHQFMLAEGIENTEGTVEDALGQELDLTATYIYNSHLTFMLGGSVYAPGDVIKSAFGTDGTAYWVYLVATASL